MFSRRKVLATSFAIQATLFVFIAVGGTYEMFHLWYFGTIFAVIGIV